MRLGLIADIHEDTNRLGRALEVLRQQGVDRIIFLGDACEMGHEIDATVELLEEHGVVGVWGNHDLGLCHEPEPQFAAEYSARVRRYMASLQPRLEIGRWLFTHSIPYLDPTDPTACYLDGRPDDAETMARCFEELSHELMFVGHYHRWQIADPTGILPWTGETEFRFVEGRQYVVLVHAVMNGWYAVFDGETRTLMPVRL